MSPPQSILIVGASGRAAAGSMLRAGVQPYVIDLFADRDTCQMARTIRCPLNDYPHGMIALAKQFPTCPWMYTGGIENYPDVIVAISRDRMLVGNSVEAIRLVREPKLFNDRLTNNNIPHPPTRFDIDDIPHGERWLRKPLRGSGGMGIKFLILSPRTASVGHEYFQQYIEGTPCSVVVNDHTILGYTEQLIGTYWLHAPAFQYAGNIGPIELPNALHTTAIVELLKSPLKDCYGVDFIVNENQSYILEVNPRYTASMEVLEYAGMSKSVELTVAKGIYYAERPLVFPDSGPWDVTLANLNYKRMPQYADIPHPGTRFNTGEPVITIFASGSSRLRCENALKLKAAELDLLLEGASCQL